jgi:hypothetical protein
MMLGVIVMMALAGTAATRTASSTSLTHGLLHYHRWYEHYVVSRGWESTNSSSSARGCDHAEFVNVSPQHKQWLDAGV